MWAGVVRMMVLRQPPPHASQLGIAYVRGDAE
jgi:hypothetical protein